MHKYQLPDGTGTDNAQEHIRAWREIGEPIAKADKSRLASFDPAFQFRRRDKSTYVLTLDEARARLATLAPSPPRGGAGRGQGRKPAGRVRLALRVLAATRDRFTPAEAARILDEAALK